VTRAVIPAAGLGTRFLLRTEATLPEMPPETPPEMFPEMLPGPDLRAWLPELVGTST
jgi:hypothetical protein